MILWHNVLRVVPLSPQFTALVAKPSSPAPSPRADGVCGCTRAGRLICKKRYRPLCRSVPSLVLGHVPADQFTAKAGSCSLVVARQRDLHHRLPQTHQGHTILAALLLATRRLGPLPEQAIDGGVLSPHGAEEQGGNALLLTTGTRTGHLIRAACVVNGLGAAGLWQREATDRSPVALPHVRDEHLAGEGEGLRAARGASRHRSRLCCRAAGACLEV